MKWEVFSKHSKHTYHEGNVYVQPINNEAYNQSLATCSGLLTGGGFEGPSEAMFLGKKVLIIPMKYQYEQLCNAEAVKKMGVPVIYEVDNSFIPKIKTWLSNGEKIAVNFPDVTSSIVENLIKQFTC